MSDTPQTEDTMVAALLRERAGYVGRKGKEDRLAAVDEQLRLRGYTPDGERIAKDTDPSAGGDGDGAGAGDSAPTEPRSTPPKGRQARATDKA